MSEHRVAFIVEYIPLLHAMLPAIQETKRNSIPCDVIVPPLFPQASDLTQKGRDDLIEYVSKLGVKAICEYPKEIKYDIVYSSYHACHEELLRSNEIRYNVRYYYGVSGGNKPDLIGPAYYHFYDFLLSLSNPDVGLSSAYIKTHLIGNIKLAEHKHSRASSAGKKTLLYLPTWGSFGQSKTSINTDTINKLVELQNKYNIFTKMHAHTVYYEQQQTRRKMFDMFDNIYDVTTPIADILNDTDVVLSDLSSAAFDAIAGDVPLALFGLGAPIYYGGKLCLHQQLVKDGIIPGTNDVNELEAVIEKALTPEYFTKQQKLKKEMFPFEGRECLDAFMKFQSDLFEDRVDPWYIASRRAIRENYYRQQRETQERHDAALQAHEAAIQAAVQATRQTYESSTSWKLTKPVRVLSKLLRR